MKIQRIHGPDRPGPVDPRNRITADTFASVFRNSDRPKTSVILVKYLVFVDEHVRGVGNVQDIRQCSLYTKINDKLSQSKNDYERSSVNW